MLNSGWAVLHYIVTSPFETWGPWHKAPWQRKEEAVKMWSCLQNQGLEVFCKSLLLIFSWPELNHLTSSQQQKRILRKRKRCGPYRPLLLPQWSLFWIATLMKMNSWGTCWSVFYRCGKNQAKSEAITEENNTKTESFCSSYCCGPWTLPWLSQEKMFTSSVSFNSAWFGCMPFIAKTHH